MITEPNALFPLVLIGLVVLGVAIWLMTRARRKATVIDADRLARDVLEEGAERERRNQALIDAAPATAKPAPQAAPPPQSAPTPSPAPAPAGADDLTRIKGIGPKLVARLGELGVTTYAQIAGWSEADVARIDAELGRFAGRITRDQWIEQAKLLAAGDEAGFAARFGRSG
jgi:predicted flap endonuclease-1-like 5' DNA nuclease